MDNRPTSARDDAPPDACAEVVHELANALAGVNGALALIERMLATGEPISRDELAEAVVSGRVATELAASILRETRSEGARDVSGEVDVGGALETAMAVVRGRVPDGARIVPLPAGRTVVLARRHALVRVLVNLLENALEATDPERPNEVVVRTEANRGALAIVIEDSGRGMDPETLARATRGLAVPRAARRGIGLVITRRVVEQMGGSLELDSVAGLGTRVRVVLRAPGGATG